MLYTSLSYTKLDLIENIRDGILLLYSKFQYICISKCFPFPKLSKLWHHISIFEKGNAKVITYFTFI